MCDTYSDMVVILPQLLAAGHKLSLRDPLLQVVHFPAQLEQAQGLIQLGATLAGQVLQTGVQFVHLRLFYRNLFTEKYIVWLKLIKYKYSQLSFLVNNPSDN